MKIFYTSSMHGIDDDLDQVCPFKNKIEGRERDIYLGSESCRKCPYCYGYGENPNEWHNLFAIPFYSRWSPMNEGRTDDDIAKDGLTNYKFVSDCDYIKCLKAYSDYGQKMFRNRFKLWWWKKIGERLSNARCWVILKIHDLKFRLYLKFKY